MKRYGQRLLSLSLGLFLSPFLIIDPAWAVQAHGGTEGLVSHQIGHVLFVIGMGYLLFRIYRTHLSGSGWFEFKLFLWLIIAWNLITFSGHWLRELIDPKKFTMVGTHIVSFKISSFSDAFFYLASLDHLFLVPAFVLLLMALRKWREQK